MRTFNDREIKLIGKLKEQPPQTTVSLWQDCPLHSYCNPLPLFRGYKIDDATFEAQWNEFHHPGIKQVFRFDEK